MGIDTLDRDAEASPRDVPAPSSPSSTHSWTPLYEQQCGPSRGDAVESDSLTTDLQRPRSQSFVREKRVKRDALQVSFAANKNFVKDHTSWWDSTLKSQINLAAIAPIDGVESAISAWVALARERPWGRNCLLRKSI